MSIVDRVLYHPLTGWLVLAPLARRGHRTYLRSGTRARCSWADTLGLHKGTARQWPNRCPSWSRRLAPIRARSAGSTSLTDA